MSMSGRVTSIRKAEVLFWWQLQEAHLADDCERGVLGFVFVEHKLAVDIAGLDIERSNAAVLAGWRILRLTPDMVENGQALALVKEALSTAK